MKKSFAPGESFPLTPCPPLRRESNFDTISFGGEGEEIKEAGAVGPPPP
jgi:hypothetical protein